jgi:hypothetical protein
LSVADGAAREDEGMTKQEQLAGYAAEATRIRLEHRALHHAEQDRAAEAAKAQQDAFGAALRVVAAQRTPEQIAESMRRHAAYVASLGLSV